MSSSPRSIVLTSYVAVLALVAGLLLAGAAPVAAATRPVVTGLSSAEGPVSGGGETVLRGRGLTAVTAVRFGTATARIKRRSPTAIVVAVPARGRGPALARVSLRHGGRWHATSKRYRYVPKPVVSRLSSSAGLVVGGERLTLTGSGLDRVTRVLVGGKAARVTARRATTLSVVTPASVAGATRVVVTSAGGTASRPFTYVTPAPSATAEIATREGTFETAGADVEWVTSSGAQGYLVSLVAGATLPEVGAPFYLAAGSSAYPSGLAGRVESLAAQEDGSVRVVVVSVPLEEVFEELDVDITQDVDLSGPAGRGGRAATPSGSLGKAFSSAFDCDSDRGFEGSLEIKVSDLTPHFETSGFGNPFSENKMSAYISGTTEVSGTIKAQGALECDLDSSWQNSRRRVVSLGYGVTYSIAPEVHLSVSAAGSVTITRTQRFLYGVHWTEDHGSTRIQDTSAPQISVEGRLAGSVTLEGGVSNRLGLLDRIGIEVEGLVYLDGEASFSAGPTGQFCLSAAIGLRAPVKLFLDYWIDEMSTTLFTITIQLGTLERCGRVWGAPDTDDPEVSTTRLPDAVVGRSYAGTLSTTDGRAGTWRTSSTLPPGLSLSEDGTVAGTPTGGVGNRTLAVTFEDTDGKLATGLVTLVVTPSTGLGGGDIQATLTWAHAADMDLHALEPDGTQIYFGNTTSPSGGELDHDSNVGCGGDSTVAENIRWPTGAAPTGTYRFLVNTFRDCGVTDLSWRLVVRVDGRIVLDRTGTGTSEWIDVTYGTARTAQRRALPAPATGPKA